MQFKFLEPSSVHKISLSLLFGVRPFSIHIVNSLFPNRSSYIAQDLRTTPPPSPFICLSSLLFTLFLYLSVNCLLRCVSRSVVSLHDWISHRSFNVLSVTLGKGGQTKEVRERPRTSTRNLPRVTGTRRGTLRTGQSETSRETKQEGGYRRVSLGLRRGRGREGQEWLPLTPSRRSKIFVEE